MADPPAADWNWWRERRLPAAGLHLADAPPAVVHLVQITSHRGLVQPAAEAAALCRAAGVPLWVDAAQALGHANTACGADAVYATSRKWLTGPRGVGLLGIAEPWWDRLPSARPCKLSANPAGARAPRCRPGCGPGRR